MLDHLLIFADAAAASGALRDGIKPLLATIAGIASVLCVFFVVIGGYNYMTSNGNVERHERAVKTIRNAFIGFVLIIASVSVVGILQSAYQQKDIKPIAVSSGVDEKPEGFNFRNFLNEEIKKFVQGFIENLSKPVVDSLKQYSKSTPLMAENPAVFNLWIVIVAMTDVLFLLVVSLIGLRIMSASALGFEDVDLTALAPQIILTFIIANTSIFAIDFMIVLSNALIQAILIGMSTEILWASLGSLFASISSLGIGLMFLVAAVIILGLILLIYYLVRVVGLYVGAVLSPLVVLLWLLPSFRDFSIAAGKTYIITIFTLFAHTIVLMVAVSFFATANKGNLSEQNAFLASLYGIAVLLILIKTNSFMNQVAFAGSSNNSMRKLGNTFVRSSSHMASTVKKGFATAGTRNTISHVSSSRSSTNIIKNSTHKASAKPISTSAPKTVKSKDKSS